MGCKETTYIYMNACMYIYNYMYVYVYIKYSLSNELSVDGQGQIKDHKNAWMKS